MGELVGLGAFLAIFAAAAAIGGRVTVPEIPRWYRALRKPIWSPPDWLFGPVWTVLYLTMGVGGWMVWRQHGWSGALALLAIQLILSVGWSVIFFGAHALGTAVAEMTLLWLAVAATAVAFFRLVPMAGYLFVPYLAWVTFAGLLTLAIWRLNR